MNPSKNRNRKKKNNGFFKGYKLRGDYFGRKLIALVSLSVLVMAAGVFAFAEFGEDEDLVEPMPCISCGKMVYLDGSIGTNFCETWFQSGNFCCGDCLCSVPTNCEYCPNGLDCPCAAQDNSPSLTSPTQCNWFDEDPCRCEDRGCSPYDCEPCSIDPSSCPCMEEQGETPSSPSEGCYWPGQNPSGECLCPVPEECVDCNNGDFYNCQCAMICRACGPGCGCGPDCECTGGECTLPSDCCVFNEQELRDAIANAGTTPTEICIGASFEITGSAVTIAVNQDITLTNHTGEEFVLTVTDNFRHFVVNGSLELAAGCDIALTRSDALKDANSNGGGVQVNANGSFILEGGEIKENRALNGGGINVNGGSLTLGNAKVKYNSAEAAGGGVYMGNNSSFTMSGGEINGNKAQIVVPNSNNTRHQSGGGVYIGNNGTFVMEGGEICNNEIVKDAGSGGGVRMGDGGSFTMINGKINNNTIHELSNQGGFGGGVITGANTVFTMKGGEISGNYASSGGGVCASIFIMEGGKITENTSGGLFTSDVLGGGGVLINASFTLKNGLISENTAITHGGGVMLRNASTSADIQGGEISGNTAGRNGGGVYIRNIESFEFEKGEISGNTAQVGGGIYAERVNSISNISIDAVFHGNEASSTYRLLDTSTTYNFYITRIFTEDGNWSAAPNDYVDTIDGNFRYGFNFYDIGFHYGPVQYNRNGGAAGTEPVDKHSPYPVGISVPILGRGTMTRADHVFTGWRLDFAIIGAPYDPGDEVVMESTNRLDLHAQWRAIRTVTFNANGGIAVEGSEASRTVLNNDPISKVPTNLEVIDIWDIIFDETFELPSEENGRAPVNSGYNLIGWSEDPNHDPGVTAGLLTDDYEVTSNLILYAVWERAEYFSFEVTTTAPDQTFRIPLAGFSGTPEAVIANSITIVKDLIDGNYAHSYDWHITWTDGAVTHSGDFWYNLSNHSGNLPLRRPGTHREGIALTFSNPGTHTVTITPNGSKDRWLAAFGFGYHSFPGTLNVPFQRNEATFGDANRQMFTKILSPITPLMTRAVSDLNEAVNFEWARAFSSLDNLTMGDEFTFCPYAWGGVTKAGAGFAQGMFVETAGHYFKMNDIFNLPTDFVSVGSNFARQMFASNRGDAFNMNDVFTMPQELTTVGDSFAHNLFQSVASSRFTMGSAFNLPQKLTLVGNYFANQMFVLTSGDAFNMNSIFNLPPDIVSVGTYFAASIFEQCNGASFKMNAVFNLPQNITVVPDYFASNMFTNCNGAAFNMNNIFTIPPYITETGDNFVSHLFFRNLGFSFSMNAVFDLPQNITSTGANFAWNMFTSCNGPNFVINDVFKFPLLTTEALDMRDLSRTPQMNAFRNALRNIRPGQTRTAISIMNGNSIPADQRNTFSGNADFGLTNDTIDNGAFSDWEMVQHNWGGPNGRKVVYVFTGLEGSGFDTSALRNLPADRIQPLSNVVNPASLITTANGFPVNYTVQSWYTSQDLSGVPYDFSTPLPEGELGVITLYAFDNVAFDNTSAHRTLSPGTFANILIGNSFNLDSVLTVNRAVTYHNLGSGAKTVTVSGDYRHFLINSGGTLNFAANINTTFTRATGYDGEGGGVNVNSGIFNMNSGTISGNKAGELSQGGGVLVTTGGTFNMHGGTISHNVSDSYGGGVYISTNARFDMSGGEISHNTVAATNAQAQGGGVWNNGVFNMSGTASINNNTAIATRIETIYVVSGLGGGVYLNTNSTFDMSGGIISQNTASGISDVTSGGHARGGGVYGSGTMTMSNNTLITKNKTLAANISDNSRGGGVWFDGTLEMRGNATISENEATEGGGIYITGVNSTLTISGNAEISENTVSRRGGGIFAANVGSIVMNGGKITGNKSANDGGGVYINQSGSFIMSEGAIISGNEITGVGNGGGVALNGNCTLNMTGGSIIGNEARNGGGVDIGQDCTFDMTGGNITSNTARDGGGISLSGRALYISGNAKIQGNEAKRVNGSNGNGGGIYITSSIEDVMISENAIISSNTAENNGGGVFVSSAGTLTMTGGAITENSANASGGGIYAEDYSGLDIRGGADGAVFNGNTAGGGAFDFGIFNWGADIPDFPGGNPKNIKWSLTGNGLSSWGNSIPGTHLLNNYDINYNRSFTVTFDTMGGTLPSGFTNPVVLETITDSDGGRIGHGGRISGVDPNRPAADLANLHANPNTPYYIPETTRESYELIGWSTVMDDALLAFRFDETTQITENTTVYAQWKRLPMTMSIEKDIDFGTNLIQRHGFVKMGDGDGYSHDVDSVVLTVHNPLESGWAIYVMATAVNPDDESCCHWFLASRMYIGGDDSATPIGGSSAPIFVYDPDTHQTGAQIDVLWGDLEGGGLTVRNGSDLQAGEYKTILDWNIMPASPQG